MHVYALPIDSIRIESEISALKKENFALASKISALDAKLESANNDFKVSKEMINAKVDSVKESAAINSENIKLTADKLDVELKKRNDELTSSISNVSSTLGNRIVWIITSIAFLLIIVIAYIILAI